MREAYPKIPCKNCIKGTKEDTVITTFCKFLHNVNSMGKNIGKLFGKNICFYRKERGLSQEQLAFQVGLEKSTVSHYECGTRTPNLKTAQKLADALGVNLAELVN